jgi:voltage-gated potassium channel
LLFLALSSTGVVFYRFCLGLSLREALLQVVMTVSTLGGDVRAHALESPRAEWFDIFFISAMIFVALLAVSLLVEAIVRGEFMYYVGTRRMERQITQLSGHYIICGFGRMGQEIARQFEHAQLSFVVVEHNPVQFPAMEASGYLYIKGDAREDSELLRAGIERAKGLVAVAATDEENVYITLSARVLNPNLNIVTRSSHANGEAKLLHAGANRVFSPYVIGGRRMAQFILHPSVVDFFDMVVRREQVELLLEEITIEANAPIHGRCISDGVDVESLGVHLLGIATADGRMLLRELTTYPVQAGDTVILLGEPTALQAAVLMLTGKKKIF